MVETTFRRTGRPAKLEDWEFELDFEPLTDALQKLVGRMLGTVFSKNGVSVRTQLSDGGKIQCDFEIEEYETYATAKTSLKDMVEEYYLRTTEAEAIEEMAKHLRDLADYLTQDAGLHEVVSKSE